MSFINRAIRSIKILASSQLSLEMCPICSPPTTKSNFDVRSRRVLLMQSAFNGTKAAPETGTTTTNATGILDLSLNSLSIKDQQQQNQTDSTPGTKTKPRGLHSYSTILVLRCL